MFEVGTEIEFSAGHFIAGYPGPCCRPHGHNWRVVAAVKGEFLDNLGLLIDFKDIKKELKKITDRFDHQMLNDVMGDIPTAENIARLIYKELKVSIPKLSSVTVYENPRSWAKYYEGVKE